MHKAGDNYTISIGVNSKATAQDSIALGSFANATASNSSSIR